MICHVGDRYSVLARQLDIPANLGVDRFIERLNQSLGMPKGLAVMGVQRDLIAEVAAHAMEDHATTTNARKPTIADYEVLLAEAM